MNILWVTLESILPANTGGRIGVFKRLEQLSKNNRIYLFYPYDKDNEAIYKNELLKFCSKVYAYKRKKSLKVLLHCIKYPYTVASRDIKEMQKDIGQCIRDNAIDIINVDFPHMAVNFLNINYKDIPIVLNEHNIEWQFYKAVSKGSRNIIKKIIYGLDSYRLKAYEEKLVRKINFNAFTFVSTKDMQYYSEWFGFVNRLYLIPVGADIVSVKPKGEHNGKCAIFVGKMSAGPNEDAALWFIEFILPKILKVIPDFKFYIVGKEPTEKILAAQSENIIVTGTVENVADYYNIADLVVLPLRYGGGVKVKLLEAISYGCAIVTTSVGAEGTKFCEEKYLKICDEADEFSKKCIELLCGNFSRDDVIFGSSNYYFYKNNLTWDHIGKKYESLLKAVLESE